MIEFFNQVLSEHALNLFGCLVIVLAVSHQVLYVQIEKYRELREERETILQNRISYLEDLLAESGEKRKNEDILEDELQELKWQRIKESYDFWESVGVKRNEISDHE